ncbi:MAG: hypothetical protein IPL71_03970 [Anaerolineales bacterium]|uniref:hypothetical protein n=1 Tax=Candidatus Villigracilis proximus TaxID=3140683 RepID=UPI00313738B6|nr:hypothetical protein [Anaerolineales bacterium]
MSISGPLLYVIVIVIVIALLFLAVWLLNEIARNRYQNRFVTCMLPDQTSLSLADWDEISPPGLDGVMVYNSTAPLKGLSDKIQLSERSG